MDDKTLNILIGVYYSIFFGYGAALFTTIFLFFAIWFMIRWRMVAMSVFFFLLANFTAYFGGIYKYFIGG